jgi:hypothetical protein
MKALVLEEKDRLETQLRVAETRPRGVRIGLRAVGICGATCFLHP